MCPKKRVSTFEGIEPTPSCFFSTRSFTVKDRHVRISRERMRTKIKITLKICNNFINPFTKHFSDLLKVSLDPNKISL